VPLWARQASRNALEALSHRRVRPRKDHREPLSCVRAPHSGVTRGTHTLAARGLHLLVIRLKGRFGDCIPLQKDITGDYPIDN
jgi:hypothetical protein